MAAHPDSSLIHGTDKQFWELKYAVKVLLITTPGAAQKKDPPALCERVYHLHSFANTEKLKLKKQSLGEK